MVQPILSEENAGWIAWETVVSPRDIKEVVIPLVAALKTEGRGQRWGLGSDTRHNDIMKRRPDRI